MINVVFVTTLAATISGLLYWGFKTLPAERWQMIASVPMTKTQGGAWHGLNLTFYGFFSATGIVFGIATAILLLASIQISLAIGAAFVAAIVAICLPASRMMAAVIENKPHTFTIAGAAFVAALLLPPIAWIGERVLRPWSDTIHALPVLAVAAIAYALAEAIGRLACISFGCCYGMPLRQASPRLVRLFRHHNLVFHGATKKAAYASGLEEEPLIPVQALTSIVFASSGLLGLSFLLAQRWRLALIVPVIGTWGWRAVAENLRADHRGYSQLSRYQVMSIVALLYLTMSAFLLPASGAVPDLWLGFHQMTSTPVIVLLQVQWILLFLYYGRSRVTASTVSFYTVSDRT